MYRGQRRKRRQRTRQQGGIIPLLLIAGKAIATGAISAAAKYGAKQALKKKKVPKISAAEWQANLKRLNRMYSRMGRKPLVTSQLMLK